MRIAILGAGAIGSYYGAVLWQGGHEVTFIARGAHLAAMLERGLHVESSFGDLDIYPVEATDDPNQVGPVDLVLVTVKSYDLDGAAQAARPLVAPDTALLPLLNGLDAADRLAAVFGSEHVLGGLTHVSASIVAPGVVKQVGTLRRITFGELDGTLSTRAQAIRQALEQAGIDTVLTPAVRRALWEKFLFIASIGGVCGLVRRPIGGVLQSPEARRLFVEAMQEVQALAQAHGIALAPDIVERGVALAEGFPAQARPSLLQDLEASRRTELDALSGTVVRLGREAGIPTPVHSQICAALGSGAEPQPTHP